MSTHGPTRILHVDGDSFFASCEIVLNPDLQERAVWVGGGRRGDGIVIAANRAAKKFGVKTGMACFEAARLCPRGVLCKPHYDEYRELSRRMFRVMEEFSPTLVPTSIDEGFLDFTTMEQHVWRNTTPKVYVNELRDRVKREVGLPVSAGLGNSARLAKLATDVGKPGFLEIPPKTGSARLPHWAQPLLAMWQCLLRTCSGRSSASGASNSGYSRTACGTNRSS